MASSKRAIGILVAIVSACALCFALGACSSEPTSEASKEAPFVGKWVISELTQGGDTITPETADENMKKNIDATYLDIKEGGAIEVSDMGSVETGTWEETSDTEITAKLKDVTITMKLEGDQLIATNDATDAVLKLRKS